MSDVLGFGCHRQTTFRTCDLLLLDWLPSRVLWHGVGHPRLADTRLDVVRMATEAMGRRHDMSRPVSSTDDSRVTGMSSSNLIGKLLPAWKDFMRSRNLCEGRNK